MITQKQVLDDTILQVLDIYIEKINSILETDVMSYYGEIHPSFIKSFRKLFELMASRDNKKETVSIILNTPGGSVESVEKMVEIVRQHYKYVNFIVPDSAMSAGTIFCMSGDKIYMDYSSSLGPIDPQVYNGENWVPALGYLDKVEELIEKSRDNTITAAEFQMLQNLDLAELRRYEQAKDLSVSLLKEWLVKYKFKDWDKHQTTAHLIGNDVTHEEKIQRAEEIATMLGNNKEWFSHGRHIGLSTLQTKLNLKIEDYTDNPKLRESILTYNDLLTDYIQKVGRPFFLHTNLNT